MRYFDSEARKRLLCYDFNSDQLQNEGNRNCEMISGQAFTRIGFQEDLLKQSYPTKKNDGSATTTRGIVFFSPREQ
jgi:hypothetical protein